ncbi:hypothetical protein JTB14_034120 [Gonioctena quinquepunctata]|nr:hypothetical protein JTB14_034120 [Gonioctena quinquepunctata]
MMKSPRVKHSGSKIPLHSDFRARGTRGDSTLKINFCNIRGLNKNINDVHHHLQTKKPDILALIETQVNSSTNKVHMLCPGYELHSRFRFKGGVCLYAKANLSCQREESLEPKDFDVMWFKLSDTKLTKFLCCLYLSPNEPSYNDLFEFLSLKLDYIQENHPTAETIIMGDFNVHNAAWLKFSNKTDDAGRQAEAFAITHGLEQLVELPTRIPDVNNQSANTLDLFLTTNPDPY